MSRRGVAFLFGVRGIGNTAVVDRSGAMPRSAWVEVRDPEGALLVSVTARIQGGAVVADLSAFPPGSRGSVQLCTDEDGSIERDPPELQELPTTPQMMVVQIG